MRQDIDRRAAWLIGLAAFVGGVFLGQIESRPAPVVTDIITFEDGSFMLETPYGPVAGCVPTQLCSLDFGEESS